jgi:hypothetical protein
MHMFEAVGKEKFNNFSILARWLTSNLACTPRSRNTQQLGIQTVDLALLDS